MRRPWISVLLAPDSGLHSRNSVIQDGRGGEGGSRVQGGRGWRRRVAVQATRGTGIPLLIMFLAMTASTTVPCPTTPCLPLPSFPWLGLADSAGEEAKRQGGGVKLRSRTTMGSGASTILGVGGAAGGLRRSNQREVAQPGGWGRAAGALLVDLRSQDVGGCRSCWSSPRRRATGAAGRAARRLGASCRQLAVELSWATRQGST